MKIYTHFFLHRETSTKYFANQNMINRNFVDTNILGLAHSFRKSS